MSELIQNDLRYVVTRLPRDIRDLLSQNPKKLFVGGGFVRATIAGEVPADIDIFGSSQEFLSTIADLLVSRRDGARLHKTKNAITVISPDRLPVQFITRWTFDGAEALVASFDFTVCQAALWRAGSQSNDPWRSAIGSRFYIDLAGRRLVYTKPVREEEAGGSMLRVIKYLKRGYTIQVDSLGHVIGRLVAKVHESHTAEHDPGAVVSGLLREVDPLLLVDGSFVDDHEEVEGAAP